MAHEYGKDNHVKDRTYEVKKANPDCCLEGLILQETARTDRMSSKITVPYDEQAQDNTADHDHGND